MQASKKQQQSLTRLINREDFVKMNKKAVRWVSHGLILQALPNENLGQRAGFTVTKKTEKSAVKRNRIKRRLRNAAAEIFPTHAKDNYDFVLIGREITRTRDYETLKKDLIWCLKKMELLK